MGNIQFEDSQILFDSSQIAFDEACCCDGVVCSGCIDGTLPDLMAVTFAGVSSPGVGHCDICESAWNKTHLLGPPINFFGSCTWVFGLAELCSSFDLFQTGSVQLDIYGAAPNFLVEVTARPQVNFEALYRVDLGTSKPDCTTFSNLSLSLVSAIGAIRCDFPPTCTLSSV